MAENAADSGTTSRGRPARPDLAAMIVPLGRALMAAEQPVLDAHGLTMWAYSVLLHLDETPIRTQAALAEAIRADKTRIIAVLDDLESRKLIRRRPDPEDRRVRLLSLTAEGRRLRDATQTAIQQGEERLLAHLPAADRAGFLKGLRALSALPELRR
ncbi:MarR family winged helix-turn-helix transcriptional regulator [Streptomyces angustmyceticus]|uniref:MarR family winged helix-turn-helix transcriptional regulator n=1 Tax=Streptomyces angustmyceticus TaxID=285578 RepID=UPI00344CB369